MDVLQEYQHQRQLSNTGAMSVLNDMFTHAYEKGAWNDRPAIDVVNMMSAMTMMRDLASTTDEAAREAAKEAAETEATTDNGQPTEQPAGEPVAEAASD